VPQRSISRRRGVVASTSDSTVALRVSTDGREDAAALLRDLLIGGAFEPAPQLVASIAGIDDMVCARRRIRDDGAAGRIEDRGIRRELQRRIRVAARAHENNVPESCRERRIGDASRVTHRIASSRCRPPQV
jgi:hypothetical protein